MSETRLAGATAVALAGHGLLILGAPGAGKSALAIELAALGGGLIADDVVPLKAEGGRVFAAPPERHPGVVEARGIGLIRLPVAAGWTPLVLALDLDQVEARRMPDPRQTRVAGVPLPLLHRPDPLQPAAIAALLRGGGAILANILP